MVPGDPLIVGRELPLPAPTRVESVDSQASSGMLCPNEKHFHTRIETSGAHSVLDLSFQRANDLEYT
jgi:hypothetical protein